MPKMNQSESEKVRLDSNILNMRCDAIKKNKKTSTLFLHSYSNCVLDIALFLPCGHLDLSHIFTTLTFLVCHLAVYKAPVGH